MVMDGDTEMEVGGRTQAGWRNWSELLVLPSDKTVQLTSKGKIYPTVVRLALIYSVETTVARMKRNVARIRML